MGTGCIYWNQWHRIPQWTSGEEIYFWFEPVMSRVPLMPLCCCTRGGNSFLLPFFSPLRPCRSLCHLPMVFSFSKEMKKFKEPRHRSCLLLLIISPFVLYFLLLLRLVEIKTQVYVEMELFLWYECSS